MNSETASSQYFCVRHIIKQLMHAAVLLCAYLLRNPINVTFVCPMQKQVNVSGFQRARFHTVGTLRAAMLA